MSDTVTTTRGKSVSAAGPWVEGQPAVYDEMVTGTGQVRAHWQGLMGRLSPLDPVAIEERRDEAVQLLRQHGVTYAIYGDPKGGERPWPLDLLPLVISAEEWRGIEAGAVQRIRLLNAILADIYGKQALVAEGRLPAALLHAGSAFLRPCRGAKHRNQTYLHLSAIDLCRTRDGRWRILADRTQAPSGAGYALENRGVLGRVLADCIGVGQVQPLAPFFAAFRDHLHALLPEGRRSRVVLLTSGPYNETYFEHVYLARHLGVTLVEGNDLTVRDREVFLKTLSGLEKVGVILRRLDDDFCDPIELRSNSALGVAGLMEAVRAETVVIANALGSGLMEAAGFKRLLAGLAPRMIEEELLLPDIETWWCGNDPDRAYVMANLDTLVIKPAFPSLGLHPVFGGELSKTEKAALIRKIDLQPTNFVGQERVQLSTAPVWNGQQLEPRAMVLRIFVSATAGGFAVMPGGLTRTSPSEGPIVTMQLGGGSKDSWVLSPSGDSEPKTPQPAPGAKIAILPHINLRAAAGELPSRVADGLFWVGRYAERADGVVRLLRTLLSGVTDAVQPWRFRDAEPLLNLAAWLEVLPVVDQAQAFDPVALVQAALLDPKHAYGIINSFQRLIDSARRVRDRLPPDCWRIFMAMERHIAQPLGRAHPVPLLLRLEELLTLGAALAGATHESMTRDAGWRFIEIGRRLERAIALIGMMRGLTAAPKTERVIGAPIDERRLLTAILSLTDARATADVSESEQSGNILDRHALLTAALADDADPRSLTFQLLALSDHLAALPLPSDGLASDHGLIEVAINLAASARNQVPDAIANACLNRAGRPATVDGIDPLRAAFAHLDNLIPQISDLLTQAYFTHVLVRSA